MLSPVLPRQTPDSAYKSLSYLARFNTFCPFWNQIQNLKPLGILFSKPQNIFKAVTIRYSNCSNLGSDTKPVTTRNMYNTDLTFHWPRKDCTVSGCVKNLDLSSSRRIVTYQSSCQCLEYPTKGNYRFKFILQASKHTEMSLSSQPANL